MDLKAGINKIADAAKDGIDNIKDTVSEASHRSAADAEQAKRDVAGDEMTTTEKIGSTFNQAKNNVQAETDLAKREARNTV